MKISNNKLYNKLLFVVSLVSIIGTIFFLRWTFFQQTDIKSLDNLYAFSQWSIPLSSRIMGDSPLFQHSGVDLLINDFDPFKINPETPIFAKLLFGLSIILFNNSHLASIVFLLLLLLFLNLIAKKFFKLDKWHRLLIITLTATSPIILEQISVPLLDLPQITLFIIHLYLLFSAGVSKNKKKTLFYIVTSGISLGLMTGTKIALYLPFIFLLDSWYLWKKKKFLHVINIVLFSSLSYALIYFPYILNHGIITWLKAQKWMVNFYLNSNVVATPGMILITAFTGLYKGWWGSGWERITAWSGSWGLGVLATIGSLANIQINKTKMSDENFYTIFIVLLILLPLFIIPFWPRYFVFFVPLFWLNLIAWIKNKKLVLLLLLFPLLNVFIISMNSYKFNQTDFYSKWEQAAYEDMYTAFSQDYKSDNSINEWVDSQLISFNEINPYIIEITAQEAQKTSFFTRSQSVEVIKTGFKNTIVTNYQLEWKMEQGVWKLNSLSEINNEIRSINSDRKESGLLCINPTKVQDWSDPYKQVSQLLKLNVDEVSVKTMRLVPRSYCMPIGEYTIDPKEELVFKPGVSFIKHE